MRTIITMISLLLLSSCGMFKMRKEAPKPLSFRDERIACIERFLKQGVKPESAKTVCDWSFTRE